MGTQKKIGRIAGILVGVGLVAILIWCMIPITILVTSDNKLSIVDKIFSESILKDCGNKTITFVENNKQSKYKYVDLGIVPRMESEVAEYVDNNKVLHTDNIKIGYSYDSLKEKLEEMNTNRIKNQYSSLAKEDNGFVVTKEIIGNYLDTDKLYDYIVQNLESNDDIELSNFYEKFDTSKVRQRQLEQEVSKIENTYINYTNECTLKLMDFPNYLFVENNKIVLKDTNETLLEEVDKVIEKELAGYDTVGNEMEFTTTNGDTIKIGGGTWGDVFDSDLESKYIVDKFKKFECEDGRTPILSQDYSNEIPNTYVEVSIADQWVWYYKDGELVMDSGCVTGTLGKCDTPHGVYYIFQKAHNVTFEGGVSSRNWMKFTERGHGLHDATWRSNSQFGTNRYTWDGSHGCVNLPLKFANELYDKVGIDTCVVIY